MPFLVSVCRPSFATPCTLSFAVLSSMQQHWLPKLRLISSESLESEIQPFSLASKLQSSEKVFDSCPNQWTLNQLWPLRICVKWWFLNASYLGRSQYSKLVDESPIALFCLPLRYTPLPYCAFGVMMRRVWKSSFCGRSFPFLCAALSSRWDHSTNGGIPSITHSKCKKMKTNAAIRRRS